MILAELRVLFVADRFPPARGGVAASAARQAAALAPCVVGAEDLLPMPVDEQTPRHRLSARQIREYNRVIAPEVLALRQRFGFSTSPALVHPFGVTEAEVKASAAGFYARGLFMRQTCLAPWLHTFFAWNARPISAA